MAVKLTAPAIAKLLPEPGKWREVGDALCPGLRVQITPAGTKSYVVRFKVNGKARKLTLGSCDRLGLSEARAQARAAMVDVSRGDDPASTKQAAKEAARAAQIADADLWPNVLSEFEKRHASRIRSGDEMMRFLRRETGDWNKKRVQEIARKDVIRLLDKIVDEGRPSTAIKIKLHLSKLFGWALSRDLIDASPVAGLPKPAVAKSRERVLSDGELRLIWLASESLDPPFQQFIQMLILSGQRRTEVAGMRCDELHNLDGKRPEWRLPAARVKNGRDHIVPLAPLMTRLLKSLPRVGGDDGEVRFCYSTTGEAPISGYSKVKVRLDRLVVEIAAGEAAKAGQSPIELKPWTFHDLRRTAATRMADIGTLPHVIEALLNHAGGARAGVAGIYNRAAYDSEKRAAVEAFERHVTALVSGKMQKSARKR